MRWDGQTVEADEQARLPGHAGTAVVRRFDAPEALETRFYEVRAKSALNQRAGEIARSVRLDGQPVSRLQPCLRLLHLGRHPRCLLARRGRDFEKEIVVKVNVPEVLRKELARPSWKREHIAMGTNTDPYQWVEGRYKLMRGIWEVMRDAANPCSILTKSPLLLRDVDLMREIAARTEISACLSVPTLDEKAWRASEPHTPHPRARLEAVGELNRAGIPTGILIAPLIPGINDAPEQIERIIELATEAGAVSIGGQTLFLRGSVRGIFFDWLRSYRPDLVPRYERLYARGAYVPDRDRRAIERAAGLHSGAPAERSRSLQASRRRALAGRTKRSPGRRCARSGSSETRGSGEPWRGNPERVMPRLRSRPPIVHHPAAMARALTLQAAQKAARARIELAIVIPLIALVLLANEYRQDGVRARPASCAHLHGDRAADPRLAAGARRRPDTRPAALQARWTRATAGTRRLPDPARVPGRGAAR